MSAKVQSRSDLHRSDPLCARRRSDHSPWVATGPNSRWVTPRLDGADASPGAYQYRLFFTLSSHEVATAAIAGSVATEDGNGGIFLNGTRVDFGASGFTAYSDLNIPVGSAFLAGLNTLDFFVNNGGTAANPTGLRVDNLVLSGATATVPPTLTVSRSGDDIRIAWLASPTLCCRKRQRCPAGELTLPLRLQLREIKTWP